GNRCYVSSSESPHERQCTAHSLAVSRNILTMKSVKKAFVRAQPMRSTTNTTLKARRSNEKPLHTIFRATFIVPPSIAPFHRGKSSRFSSEVQHPGSGYELILRSLQPKPLQTRSLNPHSPIPWMPPR